MAYIGAVPTSATFAIDTFNGDGSTVTFTLREAPLATSSILVFVGGVRQNTDTYSLSGASLVFSEAPPSGTGNIQVLFLGLNASPSIPSDGSVTANKIVDGVITGAKLAASTITGDKIGLTAINANNIVDGTITGAKIALGTITGDDIAVNQITGNLLTANCVSGNNIAAGQITGNLLASTVTTGNINLSGATSFLGSLTESANITTLMGANTTVNIAAPIVVFTANSSANSTVNFTGLAGIPVGNTSSFVIIVPNSTSPRYINAYQIDGSAVTPRWQGGAPTTGTSANTDIYSFTIIKTDATPTYNVFASVANYF